MYCMPVCICVCDLFKIIRTFFLLLLPQMDLEYDDLKLNFTGLTYTHSFVVGAAKTSFSTIIEPIIFSKVGGLQRIACVQTVCYLLLHRIVTIPSSRYGM